MFLAPSVCCHATHDNGPGENDSVLSTSVDFDSQEFTCCSCSTPVHDYSSGTDPANMLCGLHV